MDNKDRQTSQTTNCLVCKHLIKETSNAFPNTYHAKCGMAYYGSTNLGGYKYIKCQVPESSDHILRPTWCPLIPGAQTQTTSGPDNPYYERRRRWDDVKEHVSWDEIQIGELYRIPVVQGVSGKTIKIMSKTQYSISGCEILPDGTESSMRTYIYPGDTKRKYIVKLKKF